MTATNIFASGLDEQLICERTGHTSNAVRNYKHTSAQQLMEISNVLHGNAKKSKTTPSASVSKNLEDNDADFIIFARSSQN